LRVRRRAFDQLVELGALLPGIVQIASLDVFLPPVLSLQPAAYIAKSPAGSAQIWGQRRSNLAADARGQLAAASIGGYAYL
jgi:hypothetical protein